LKSEKRKRKKKKDQNGKPTKFGGGSSNFVVAKSWGSTLSAAV
jgi:hypothetical protein